jgi:hypothetical protein
MATKKSHAPSKKQRTIQITKTQVLLQRNKRLHIALALFVVVFIAVAGYAGARAARASTNKARLHEIITVYDSLKLEDSYSALQTNIFGDKRVYDWDKSRTFASKVEYFHNATPASTRADLRSKAGVAGFTFVQTEYEGSIQPIDEYKNDKGNYVRVGVMSQANYESLFLYRNPNSNDPLINHKDKAPTHVSIWVNLDDNNE